MGFVLHMRVLLRHDRTEHYYCGNCDWTTQGKDATDFETVERALEQVTNHRLDGMSIVIRDEECGKEQVFNLDEVGAE